MVNGNKINAKIIQAARKLKMFDTIFILVLAALVGLAGDLVVRDQYIFIPENNLLEVYNEIEVVNLRVRVIGRTRKPSMEKKGKIVSEETRSIKKKTKWFSGENG